MKTFFRFLVRMFFLFTSVAYGLACSSPFIPVEHIGVPNMLSLFMMGLLFGIVAITVICLFMRMWILGVIGILIIVFSSSLWTAQFGLHFFKSEANDEGLTLFTYNTQNFITTDSIDTMTEFLDWIESQKKTDLFVFQELRLTQAREIGNRLPDYFTTAEPSNASAPRTILFSKYPIVSIDKKSDGFSQRVYSVDIDVSGQTYTVIPTHMQSNAVTRAADQFYDQIKENRIKHFTSQFKHIVKSYFTRSKERMLDWEKMKPHIKNNEHPVVMLGDFNDTPYSALYHDIETIMADSFKQAGAGLARTFRIPFPSIKIDHIFVSENLHCKNIKVINLPFSDHNGLWAHIQINE